MVIRQVLEQYFNPLEGSNMKRCTFFLFVAMMVAMSDANEDILIEREFVFQEYNDITKRQVKKEAHIFYTESDGVLTVIWEDFIPISRSPSGANNPYHSHLQIFGFKPNERLAMSKLLDKYFEWRSIAIENKVSSMQKVIGEIEANFLWRIGEVGEVQRDKASITLGFLSQTATRHQLFVRFPKVEDDSSHKFNSWYLDEEQARLLAKCISQEYIEKKVEESKKGAATRDLFK